MGEAIKNLKAAIGAVSIEMNSTEDQLDYKAIKSAYHSLCSALYKLEERGK
jgi:hypothetical protein